MLIQGQVGPIASSTSLAAGVQATARMDNLGGLAASQLLPRYYETTYRRSMYTVANQSATVTTVGLAQTYQGLCIANPTTSTVNVVITKAGYAFPVAPAAAVVVGLMTGSGTTISAGITPRNRFVGGVSAQCLASAGSLSLPSIPVLETVLGTVLTGAITTQSQQAPTLIDLEGSLILPPGAFCAFYTSTAANTSGFFGSFQWVEVPL